MKPKTLSNLESSHRQTRNSLKYNSECRDPYLKTALEELETRVGTSLAGNHRQAEESIVTVQSGNVIILLLWLVAGQILILEAGLVQVDIHSHQSGSLGGFSGFSQGWRHAHFPISSDCTVDLGQ